MLIKQLLIPPYNEILESLPENQSILFRFGEDWHYFLDSMVVGLFGQVENYFRWIDIPGYYLLVVNPRAIQVIPIGEYSELIDFWLNSTVIVGHRDHVRNCWNK